MVPLAGYTTEDVVLEQPTFTPGDIDFDELSRSLAGLQGQVDPHPSAAAIILAGGTGDHPPNA